MGQVSMIDQLSQEVIDEILDHCAHTAQINSLKACSLVCSAFRSRCQQHLYSTVVFKSRAAQGRLCAQTMAQRVETFLEILDMSPWIAGYVQELRLQVKNSEEDAFGDGLLRVMSLIKEGGGAIQRLTLRGRDWTTTFRDNGVFVRSFVQPYISPFITSLYLDRLNFVLIGCIADCVHLKSLSLRDLGPTVDKEFGLSPQFQNRPAITKLEVAHSDDFVKALLAGQAPDFTPYVNFSRLRSLNSRTRSAIHCQESLQTIINIAGSSLEEMELSPAQGYCDDLHYLTLLNLLNFTNSTGLKQLTIDFKVGSPDEIDPIAGLVSILKTVPTDNQMARMKFRLCLGFNTAFHPDRCLELNWRSLDLEIARISNKKPLRLLLDVWYQEFIQREPEEGEENEAPTEPSNDEEPGIPQQELEERCNIAFRKVVDDGLSLISGDPSITIEVTKRIVEPCEYCRTYGVFPVLDDEGELWRV